MSKSREKYKKEKGFDVWVKHPNYGSYTDDYVNWLEYQLKDKKKVTFSTWKKDNLVTMNGLGYVYNNKQWSVSAMIEKYKEETR